MGKRVESLATSSPARTAYWKITPAAFGSNPFGQTVVSSAVAPVRSAPVRFALSRFARSGVQFSPGHEVRDAARLRK
jgi:hypothetical protein